MLPPSQKGGRARAYDGRCIAPKRKSDMLKGRLLIVDDDRVFCAMLTRHFEEEYEVTGISDPEEALRSIKGNPVDVVLTDLSMPKVDGMEILKTVKAVCPDTDVLMMTAYAKVETAVEAMKQGAYDYIVKPFTAEELSLHLNKIFEKRGLLEENISLRKFIDLKYRPENIIGESDAIKGVRRFIERVSLTDEPVLITGESGTGKELVARAIHFSGKRKGKRFVSVHCGALTQGFLEQGLFGPGEGGPPRAVVTQESASEAGGGTLVLSEIGDMDLSLQAKLLAALETGRIRRTQGSQEVPFDIMVIATTNKDLARLQREGRFRQDLFHRLNTFGIMIPPLRQRKEDIPLLAGHFFSQYRNEFEKPEMRLSREAVEVLQNYDWPGNVRELKSLFAKVCLMEDVDVVRPEHLLSRLPKPQEEVISYLDSGRSLGDIERNLIMETLRRADGNMAAASKLLNISYETLRYRMKKFGISQKPYRKN
jgi:DNA-binding NtrC family response regulator